MEEVVAENQLLSERRNGPGTEAWLLRIAHILYQLSLWESQQWLPDVEITSKHVGW